MLILHIVFALTGILLATVAVITYKRTHIRLAKIAAASTLASGIILTIMHPARLVQTCITGLVYFAFAGFIIALAERRAKRHAPENVW